MKKAILVVFVAFGGLVAQAQTQSFAPVTAPETLRNLTLYPGAYRLTDAKDQAALDASIGKLFTAVNIKCTSIEEVFWSSKVPKDKILTGFALKMNDLKYSFDAVKKIKTGSIIKIKAGQQELHGLWNYTKSTTMLALCK